MGGGCRVRVECTPASSLVISKLFETWTESTIEFSKIPCLCLNILSNLICYFITYLTRKFSFQKKYIYLRKWVNDCVKTKEDGKFSIFYLVFIFLFFKCGVYKQREEWWISSFQVPPTFSTFPFLSFFSFSYNKRRKRRKV